MKHILNIPYELRMSFSNKINYDAKNKVMFYDGEVLPEEFIPFQPKVFSFEWNMANKLNKVKPKFKFDAIWKPKPHQVLATTSMQHAYKDNAPGYLLADTTGVGKTVISMDFALKGSTFKKILIICPVSVIAHWRNTLINLGVDSSKEIMLINYERLGKLFEVENKSQKMTSTRSKGKQKRIAKEFAAPEYDLILVDESHKCKNITSARSILVDKLTAKAKFTIWMSATAGQTPLELAYLKRLLAKKTKSTLTSMKDFEVWCKQQGLGVSKGAYGAWKWDGSQEDIDKIKHWLFEGSVPYGIRRRPEDIAGWREMERNLFAIDLEPAELLAYNKTWNDFKTEEMEKIKARRASKDTSKMNPLVESLRFRQKSSWLKIDNTIDVIMEHLEKGLQIAVSVEFVETGKRMIELLAKKKVKATFINGSQNPAEKEANRMSFQRGDCQVIIFTVVEGISLHQGEHNDVPRVLLIHDIRWSAIQMAQIEGRCHRDGYFSPCYWVYANETMDEKIGHILAHRVNNMKAMMGDDTSLLKEILAVFLTNKEQQ